MAKRTFSARHGVLHALLVVALAACGSTDPPAFGIDEQGIEADLRLPRAVDLVITPSGPHVLLPTLGFGKTVAIDGARVAVAEYLDWQFQELRLPHVNTFEIVDGVAVPTGQLPAEGYGEVCFGRALALAGDLIAVGEPCANGGAGEVHVYLRTGGAWVEEPALAPATATGVERFGSALGMAANRMVVGAPGEPAVGPDGTVHAAVGAVYAYTRSGGAWRLEARLVPADGAENDSFGWAVSMDASLIAATSPGRWNGDELGNPIGANGKTYLFERPRTGGWVERVAFVVGDGLPGEWTGQTVALCSGTLFVGSETWSWPAVHKFQATLAGWVEGDLYDPAPPVNGHVDNLACDGGVLGVGMPYAGPTGQEWTGTARVYAKLGGLWLRTGEIAGAGPGDRAGHSVAVDGSVVAVGIPSALVEGRTLGMVRVHRF